MLVFFVVINFEASYLDFLYNSLSILSLDFLNFWKTLSLAYSFSKTALSNHFWVFPFIRYVIITSRTRFRVNLHSIVAWISRNSLLETDAISEFQVIATIHFEMRTDMIITYSQIHRIDKYWQHSSIIWSVWLNGWVFVYKLSGYGFESRCFHYMFKHLTIAAES